MRSRSSAILVPTRSGRSRHKDFEHESDERGDDDCFDLKSQKFRSITPVANLPWIPWPQWLLKHFSNHEEDEEGYHMAICANQDAL